MTRPVVVLDACVLYPAPLRDLLLHLALADLFQAKWTEAIHDEWIRAVLRDRPDLARRQLLRTRRLMDAHVRDCLVADYEHLIPALTLPDPHDRHVLAAALHARADAIVTFNLADFPSRVLAAHGLVAIHPDPFVGLLLDAAPQVVCAAVRRQRTGLQNPRRSAAQLRETLRAQGLPRSVARLQQWSDSL